MLQVCAWDNALLHTPVVSTLRFPSLERAVDCHVCAHVNFVCACDPSWVFRKQDTPVDVITLPSA